MINENNLIVILLIVNEYSWNYEGQKGQKGKRRVLEGDTIDICSQI